MGFGSFVWMLVSLALLVVLAAVAFSAAKRQKSLDRLSEVADSLRERAESAEAKVAVLQDENEALTGRVNALARYQGVVDAVAEAQKIKADAGRVAKAVQHKALQKAKQLIAAARDRVAEEKQNGERVLAEMYKQAEDVKAAAKSRAAEERQSADRILAEAYKQAADARAAVMKSQARADLYEAAATAARNQIQGYGDEYLIPGVSLLDNLAEDFEHKEAGRKLKAARAQVRALIKNDGAALCDYAAKDRKATAIRFVIDAYNGKVDTALAKVKHDNYGKIKQQLDDAFQFVNYNGSAFRNARITEAFHVARMDELYWAVAAHELQLQEREEQKAIREQMREEERARREYEKARKDAEKEERLLQKAMIEARRHLEQANEQERQAYQAELEQLQAQLAEAESRNERALSMAQQTRAGHVYVISNIGSFGEEVFKVGMTRRLEPMDRVKELGDASVPFEFDVHAMIYSEDAPALEKALHSVFDGRRVNQVNRRKEFFRVPVLEIRQVVEGMVDVDVHWTMKAEAQEYRESVSLITRDAQQSQAALAPA